MIPILINEWISKDHQQNKWERSIETNQRKKTADLQGRKNFIVNRTQLKKKNPNYYHQREECYENQQRHTTEGQTNPKTSSYKY